MYFMAGWMVPHCGVYHLHVFFVLAVTWSHMFVGFIHFGASQAVATIKQIRHSDESACSVLLIVCGYFYLL